MKLLNSLAFPLFLIFFISDPCRAFSQGDFLITDLDNLDSSGFTTEASSWTSQSVSCPSCIFFIPSGSSCGSAQEAQMVYGGPEAPIAADGSQSFGRSYSTSGTTWLNSGVGFEVWVFTTSELSSTNSLNILTVQAGKSSNTGVGLVFISSCSIDYQSTKGSHIKFIYKFQARTSTSGSATNTMSFGVRKYGSSGIPASIDSIGFRNLKIYNTGSSYADTYSVNFPCANSKFWDGNSCEACQSTCLSCSGSNPGQCTTCTSSSYDYGNGTCSSTACSGLFESIPITKKCTERCLTGFSWQRNLSCIETCEAPLVKSTYPSGTPLCSSPCPDATQYVYPNQSCLSTCDSRLKDIDEPTIKLCLNPCQTSSMFVYPDGSCENTCLSPLQKNSLNGIQYCENPCFENNTFLYEDGTCKGTCASPSIAKNDPVIGKSCKLPCSDKNYYYNTQNGKCTKTCEYPGEAVESPLPKLCRSSLTEEEVEKVKAIADATNNANTASSTIAMIWSFLSSSDSTSACLGPLAKMLQYIKFMDIMFPEKVLILMDAQSKDSGGFSAKMMGDALKKFPTHELPRKFKVYQASSSFFVNFWPALFNLSVILFVTMLVMIGAANTKGRPKINGILKNLKEILKWNVFLIIFSGNIGDIVLYTALEFQTMQFDNAAAVFSFLLCLGINTLAVLVVIQIVEVNSAIRASKKTAKGDSEEQKKMIEQEWGSYKALFECYKDYSFYQSIFLFVFLVRLALFNAIIGYFYSYPLFQASTAVASNMMMLGYLLIKRPMKKLVNLIQQVVLELVLLPFNVCVLALAIMDDHEIVETNRRKSIGDVIVYINLIVPVLSTILMAAKAIVMGVDFYKTWKQAKANKLKKLASVQSDFRSQDLFNTSDAKFESLSQSKNFAAEHTQILDITLPTNEHSSVRSNQMENPRKRRPLRPNFMMNSAHQNSAQMTIIQHVDVGDSSQQHQMGLQEVTGDQYFQNETQDIHPQNHRRKIDKKMDHTRVLNNPSKIKFGN